MPLPRATLKVQVAHGRFLQIKVYKNRLVPDLLTLPSDGPLDTERVSWLPQDANAVIPILQVLQGAVNLARGKPPSHVPSRAERWAEAAGQAREAVDQLKDALASLESIQEEFSEWMDSMPENAQGGSTYQLLEAICGLELLVDDAENTVSEVEGVEVPQGWGRD